MTAPNLFCLDTSVLIEGWIRHYKPSRFPSFWNHVHESIEGGLFISPIIVMDEIKRKDDELYAWAKERMGLFVPLTDDVQREQDVIINRFRRMTDQSTGKSLADPWVIALAKLRNCPVVTYEGAGSEKKPKIPYVCLQLGVSCLQIHEVIETLKWTF